MSEKKDTSIRNYLINLLIHLEDQTTEEPNEFLPPKPVKDHSCKSSSQLLTNLQVSIMKLLTFKSLFNNCDLYDLAIENEKYEKLIQQNESQVRKKLKIQNELRIQIQDQKWKLDQLENQDEQVKKLKKKLEDQLVFLKIPKKFDENKVKIEMGKKIADIEKNIKTTEERISLISKENLQLQENLKEKESEMKILKKEKRRLQSVAHSLVSSPKNISAAELQPSIECSIFLSSILEKEAVRSSFDFRFLSPSLASNREKVTRPRVSINHSRSSEVLKIMKGNV
jgi:hypothetical protein